MAGGCRLGLTSQTLCPLSCGSDRIFLGNTLQKLTPNVEAYSAQYYNQWN